jgi:outer membrane immunogenic protein
MKMPAFSAVAMTVAVVAVAAPASATDLAPRRQPLLPSGSPLALFDWSGFYAGVNGGADFGETHFGLPAGTPPGRSDPIATRPDGAPAGTQIGYNRQLSPWLFGLPVVVGLEFTGDWAGLKKTVAGPAPMMAAPGAVTTRLDNLETVTARFGVVLNNWLIYAKAGGATATVSLHAASAGASFDQSNRAIGTAFASGIEYGLTANLVIGVEYDFVRLFPGPFTGIAANGAALTADGPSAFDIHSIAARLSYRF